MSYLGTTEDFEAELLELRGCRSGDAELIDALIDELQDDEECLRTLTFEVPKWHWKFAPPFEFKRFEEAWRDRRRIFFLKPYNEDGHLLDHRVFLGYDLERDEFYALSIQHRSTCYDTSTESYRVLCDRYDRLEIPAIVIRN